MKMLMVNDEIINIFLKLKDVGKEQCTLYMTLCKKVLILTKTTSSWNYILTV